MPPGDHPVVRARWLILAVFAAACVWLVPGVATLQHDDDVLAFLPPGDPDVVGFREVADEFGMLEVVLLGLERDGADLLTEDGVASVRSLARRVEEIDQVHMVLSFADLPHPQIVEGGLEVAALVPETMSDAGAIRERVLRSTDAVGNFISSDGTAAALLVYLRLDPDTRTEQRTSAMHALHAAVRDGWDGRAMFGGAPYMEHTAAESSRADIRRLSPIVIAVLVITSALLLGSITAAGLNLVIAGLGVGLVVGGHGVFGEPLSIVSSTVPVMMVALGGAFGVHMLAGYQRQEGTSRVRASATFRELWAPVALSGTTTSVAFFALLVMPQQPMQRFGVAAGCGVLLLMFLALGVLPALLSVLPDALIVPRPERRLAPRVQPPVWVLVLVTVAGLALGTSLRADPDTINVFDEDSEPRRTNAFFDEHFAGSVFLQIAVEADLREPVVLREIRDISDEIRGIDGIADVRSVVEPVALITAALGGRAGIPATEARTRRALTFLADHPAMAQLMTPQSDGALIHVKLAPVDGDRQVQITDRVRDVLARHITDKAIAVGSTDQPTVAAARSEDIRARVAMLLDRELTPEGFEQAIAADALPAQALDEIRRLRDQALDSDDSPVEGVPRSEIDTIDPAALVTPRGRDLEALLSRRLPTLVDQDPKGIGLVAEFLGSWVDDALPGLRATACCEALGVDQGGCETIAATLSELSDTQWRIGPGVEATAVRTIPRSARLTGQPVVGQAFARSVTRSLYQSTLVSLLALAVMLAPSRQLQALVPAAWTVMMTAGAIALLGHPISIGTSMVACIALGAGVDFAIHLGVRARRLSGDGVGRQAVEQIGAVTLISAAQLALAFAVLTASRMPPLREFGVGLAIGLLGAAAGAVWLTPLLVRRGR